MGFANLQTLENRLSSLKSNLSSYNTQLDKQRRRKENIESIIKEMKRICSNWTDDVNTHLNKMINNYEDAAKGVASTLCRADNNCISSRNIQYCNFLRLVSWIIIDTNWHSKGTRCRATIVCIINDIFKRCETDVGQPLDSLIFTVYFYILNNSIQLRSNNIILVSCNFLKYSVPFTLKINFGNHKFLFGSSMKSITI